MTTNSQKYKSNKLKQLIHKIKFCA